jgi:hypothetical protein
MIWQRRHEAIDELATLVRSLNSQVRDSRAAQQLRGPRASIPSVQANIDATERDLVFIGALLSWLVLNDTTSMRRRWRTLSASTVTLAEVVCPILYAEMTK